jgi:hypothetical protein
MNILLETQKEYTYELVKVLTPYISKYYTDMYKETERKNKNQKLILKEFQQSMSAVSQWTDEDKVNIYETIKNGNEWLDNLVQSIFILKSKIMSSLKNSQDKLEIELESSQELLYRCFLNTGRELWKRPYLMYHKVSKVDYRRHMEEFVKLISRSIKDTVRSSLPLKELIKHQNTPNIQHIVSDEKHTIVKYDGIEDFDYDDDTDTTDDDEESEDDLEDEDDTDDDEQDDPIEEVTEPEKQEELLDEEGGQSEVDEPIDEDEDEDEHEDDENLPIDTKSFDTFEEETTKPDEVIEETTESPQNTSEVMEQKKDTDNNVDIKSIEIVNVGKNDIISEMIGEVVEEDVMDSEEREDVKLLEIENEFF